MLEHDTIASLERAVNEYVTLGWRPIGGATAVRQRTSGPLSYIQAVFKENSIPVAPASPVKLQLSKRYYSYKKKRGRPTKNDNSNDAA